MDSPEKPIEPAAVHNPTSRPSPVTSCPRLGRRRRHLHRTSGAAPPPASNPMEPPSPSCFSKRPSSKDIADDRAKPCEDDSSALSPILPTPSSAPAPPPPSKGIAGDQAEPCVAAPSPIPVMASSAPAPPPPPILPQGMQNPPSSYSTPRGQACLLQLLDVNQLH